MRKIGAWFGLARPAAEVRASIGDGAGDVVVVLGCPLEGGEAFRGGASAGPAEIRRWTTTADAIDEHGRDIEGLRLVDLGDVELEAGAGALGEARWRALESAAGGGLAGFPGAFLLGLGGDHSVTPPLASAARAAAGELAFVLLDAHPDAFDVYDGDPLSHACVLSRVWDRGGFEPATTCVAGVRSAARQELPVLREVGLTVSAAEWCSLGAEALAERLHRVTGGRPLYVSLDIDVLDAAAAPGTGYPVAGGPGARQLLSLLEAVWQRQKVAAMDLVEVAPKLDPSGVTAATAAHVLLQVLGHVARHRRPQ